MFDPYIDFGLNDYSKLSVPLSRPIWLLVCLHCFRSSVGPQYARNRAIVYLMIGLIFLGAGIGVTVSLFCNSFPANHDNCYLLTYLLIHFGPGRVAQSVTCLATDACLTADPGVASSIPARSHTFVEIDHEIISTVILFPSADSFKKGCCQLQAKVCAQITG